MKQPLKNGEVRVWDLGMSVGKDLMTNRCLRCLQIIDADRKALGFSRCISCQPQWAYKGALNFGHKTGGSIQPMHPDVFKVHKRVTARKAKGTNGAAFQTGTCVITIKDA